MGEAGLVLFIVLLIVASGKLPRLGERLGERIAGYHDRIGEKDSGVEVKGDHPSSDDAEPPPSA